MEIASEAVGENIAVLRRARELSARAVAVGADLDLSHLQRVERGAVSPTLRTLVQIAVALDVEVSELVAGVGPRHAPPGSPARPCRPRGAAHHPAPAPSQAGNGSS